MNIEQAKSKLKKVATSGIFFFRSSRPPGILILVVPDRKEVSGLVKPDEKEKQLLESYVKRGAISIVPDEYFSLTALLVREADLENW
jgi:hypothetical protein